MGENSWMTNYNFIAFMAHSCSALSLMLLTGYLLGSTWTMPMALAIMVFAGVKEFWYDIKYELPKQTVTDGFLDFAGYIAGTFVGSLVVMLAHHYLGK